VLVSNTKTIQNIVIQTEFTNYLFLSLVGFQVGSELAQLMNGFLVITPTRGENLLLISSYENLFFYTDYDY
jgi:hypothetical protein